MSVSQTSLFAKPATLKEMQVKYKSMWAVFFSFLDGSCCIDTQPPMPPGTGK